jgi:hypothetical protein
MPSTLTQTAAIAEAPASFEQAAEALFRDLGEIKVRLGPDGPALCDNLIVRTLDLVCAARRNTPGWTGPRS